MEVEGHCSICQRRAYCCLEVGDTTKSIHRTLYIGLCVVSYGNNGSENWSYFNLRRLSNCYTFSTQLRRYELKKTLGVAVMRSTLGREHTVHCRSTIIGGKASTLHANNSDKLDPTLCLSMHTDSESTLAVISVVTFRTQNAVVRTA